MVPIKAKVLNGRLVVDEATDLPEGTELELTPIVDHDRDALDPHERRELHRSLAHAAEEIREGRLVEGGEVLRRLRSRG